MRKIRAELNLFRYSHYFKWFVLALVILYSGILCNLLVVKLNGGMPIVGFEGDSGAYFVTAINKVYVPFSEVTRLAFLGDTMIFGDYAVSIGDALMFVGSCAIVMILSTYMVSQSLKERRYRVCVKSTNTNFG